jgi:hypothetical protein
VIGLLSSLEAHADSMIESNVIVAILAERPKRTLPLHLAVLLDRLAREWNSQLGNLPTSLSKS